ncbi:ribonuclease H-like domain-containing protein [Tanacetum coccineum]
MESQSETTRTVSALKLPVLKTGDYDLWSMRMEQYLTHTDYALWEVIVNGDAPTIASASVGTEGLIPPKTTEQQLARKNELKGKSTLLLSIPDEHLLKFHGIKDAKTLWEAIKARFGGNKESKKIQKTILKQQYENFAASRSEGLEKTYDRNKSDLDTLSMDDLYNNLKVYESEIKVQSSSSLNSQNVAFVSSKNTSSTNEAVNTAHEVSTASLQGQASSSTYADDVMFSFFANQSNKTVGFDKTKVECYNCHRRGYFARECKAPRNQGNKNEDGPRRNAPVDTSTTNALVVQDGIGGYDWSFQAEEGITNFALMAYTSQGSSSSLSSDSEVHTCSKDCLKSYETLQKQYDQQRGSLNKSNLEIIGYQMGLESLEARIVVHEKNEAVYEEDIAFLKYDVQVKDLSIKDLKNQLEEALKEKGDLQLKLEKFEESSKNLTKLINSQISAKDKAGLGYNSQINENEVVHSVFNSRESNVDDSPVNDRFKTGEGFHAVPPPYTGNYMPSRPDLSFAGLDDSFYKTKISETKTNVSKTSKDIVEKLKTIIKLQSKSGQVPLNVLSKALQSRTNQLALFRPVITAAPKSNVEDAITHNIFLIFRTFTSLKQVVSAAVGKMGKVLMSQMLGFGTNKEMFIDHTLKISGSYMLKRFDYGNPQYTLQDQGIFDSGCSRHMTGNKSFLTDYQEIDGGFVAFAGSAKGAKITGKGKIRT